MNFHSWSLHSTTPPTHLSVGPFPAGLSAVYGPNGSGKTTLIDFVRRLLQDVPADGAVHEERNARALRGSVTLAHGDEQIRYVLGDDAVVRTTSEGTADEQARLRWDLPTRRDYVALATVTVADCCDWDALLGWALRHNLDLRPRQRADAHVSAGMTALGERAERYVSEDGRNGELVSLRRERNRVAEAFDQWRSEQDRLMQRLQATARVLDEQLRHTRAMEMRCHADWAAAVTDLREAEDRLWNAAEQSADDHQRQQALRELENLTAQIDHARQMLRDLAKTRLSLTLDWADHLGQDPTSVRESFKHGRESVTTLERQVLALRANLHRLQRASQQMTQCEPAVAAAHAALEELQPTVYRLCENLSGYQSATETLMARTDRMDLDRSEMQIESHLQMLTRHRSERVAAFVKQFGSVPSEAGLPGCECLEHHAATPHQHARWDPAERARREEEVTRHRQRAASLLPIWRSAQKDVRRLRNERRAFAAEIRRSAADRRGQVLQTERCDLDRRIREAELELDGIRTAEAAFELLNERFRDPDSRTLLARASEYLRRLTCEAYVAFDYDVARQSLAVVSQSEQVIPHEHLSRGTSAQAALALRMSILDAMSEQALAWPLLLDDVLVEADERRAAAAVKLLCEWSHDRQVILLTCQRHLVEQLIVHNVPVQAIGGGEALLQQLTAAHAPAAAPARPAETPGEPSHEEKPATIRLDGGDAFWLNDESSILSVPSVSSQMARNLAGVGIATAGSLVQVPYEQVAIALGEFHVTAARYADWQAEALLLCCVPGLTARDAQVLVAASIRSVEQLTAMNEHELERRINQWREFGQNRRLVRLADPLRRSDFSRWIHQARFARRRRETFLRPPRLTNTDRMPVRTRTLVEAAPPARRPERNGVSILEHRARQRASVRVAPVEVTPIPSSDWKHFLDLESAIVDAPSIGPKTARRLERHGVAIVRQLLAADTDQLARKLKMQRVKPETIREWQQQSRLMCRIPQLRGHDAQILVACGFVEPDQIARLSSVELFSVVGPFVETKEGQRLLRSARTPDLQEITDWITWAQHARALKAA